MRRPERWIAAQQADAAAETIGAAAGADVTPTPFRPVLRGMILTGGAPLYARTELAEMGPPSTASPDALWWPPAKIVGRHLAPYLAEHSGAILTPPPAADTVPVDVELTSSAAAPA